MANESLRARNEEDENGNKTMKWTRQPKFQHPMKSRKWKMKNGLAIYIIRYQYKWYGNVSI